MCTYLYTFLTRHVVSHDFLEPQSLRRAAFPVTSYITRNQQVIFAISILESCVAQKARWSSHQRMVLLVFVVRVHLDHARLVRR